MIFLVVCAFMLLLWSLLGQRKVFSASFANLVGTILFVVLGLQFEPNADFWTSVFVGIGFYLFLVLGEFSARRLPLNIARFKRFGQMLVSHPIANRALTICFVVFCFIPVFQILTTGLSLGDAFASVWMTNTAPATSRDMIEMSGRTLTGGEAFINALQTQLTGFWYLSLGVLLIGRRRYFFPLLAIYIAGSFLTSGGFRSLLMVSILLPVLLVLMARERPKRRRVSGPKHHWSVRLVTVLLVGALVVSLLLLLDWLRYGRQGLVSEGTVMDRLERTIRTDFAYGGMGLRFGISNMPESMDRGLEYAKRTLLLPVPRALWPEKPTSNPNQEYTELVTGLSYTEYGSILLFTPLGEALYHFGYFGLVLIPFLYGFVVAFLERIYSSSAVYLGLLAQVFIWAVLAMRLTFYNLFATLVVTNFVLILILVIGSRIYWNRVPVRAKLAQNGVHQ